MIVHTERHSCFAQFSLEESPFAAQEETEEEAEEIIETRGVRVNVVVFYYNILIDGGYC